MTGGLSSGRELRGVDARLATSGQTTESELAQMT